LLSVSAPCPSDTDFVSLLFAAFAVGGLYIGIVSYAEESSLSDLLGGILGSFCCGLFAYFSYFFYIRPYFDKGKDKEDT
jgi:H+/Cl- antiporter ClcA